MISVGSHEEDDPLVFYANPDPPVEFFARGVERRGRLARRRDDPRDRQQLRDAGISAIAALVLSKHPQLTPFQLKSVLYLISTNVGGSR